MASVTKPIVTVAATRLIELRTLALDAPVTRHLPDFRPRLADGTEAVITLNHLLSHTASLGYRFLMAEGSAYDRLDDDAAWWRADAVTAPWAPPPSAPPARRRRSVVWITIIRWPWRNGPMPMAHRPTCSTRRSAPTQARGSSTTGSRASWKIRPTTC
ncbi:serine hydrolase [Nitrosovibrio sp. Nv4]|uniref:serine hydrolase n=1 Tax=Nitrosovibrio sp. Nv4 TaxID=1945880 RepID=UPI003519276A